jgi:hypothetical protein
MCTLRQRHHKRILASICSLQEWHHQADDRDQYCTMMVYSQTPNKSREEAVKPYTECDSYQAPITRLLFTTYCNLDKASYQQ